MARFPKHIWESIQLFRSFLRVLENELVQAETVLSYEFTDGHLVDVEAFARVNKSIDLLEPGENPSIQRLEYASNCVQTIVGDIRKDQKRFLTNSGRLSLHNRINELFNSSSETVWSKGRALREQYEEYKAVARKGAGLADLRTLFTSLEAGIISAEKEAADAMIAKTLAPAPARVNASESRNESARRDRQLARAAQHKKGPSVKMDPSGTGTSRKSLQKKRKRAARGGEKQLNA